MSDTLQRYAFSALGSDCTLLLDHHETGLCAQAAEQVMAETWRIESKFSRFLNDNTLAAINQAGQRGGSVRVDEETAQLIDYAFAAYQLSGGLFDISSGVLQRAWDFTHAQLPDAVVITELLTHVGLQHVEWSKPVLRFSRPGMALDFGGLGKEYAVDRAADLCLALGLQHGLIDFGGDLRALGPQPDGSPWLIGLRHPRQPACSLGNLTLMHGALATSGDYERYVEIDGQRYCHVLNPHTGWPVNGMASVTVQAEHCLLAGTLSTIAMLKGAEAPAWLQSLGIQHHWVNSALQRGSTLLFS